MEGFKKIKLSIKLLTGNLAELYPKAKYYKLFDYVVISLKSDSILTPEFNTLLN